LTKKVDVRYIYRNVYNSILTRILQQVSNKLFLNIKNILSILGLPAMSNPKALSLIVMP
jgi:hypothetical protein